MNTINVNNEITAIINAAKTAIPNAGTKDSAAVNYRLAYEAIVKLMSKATILQFVLCLIIRWAQPSQKRATLLRDVLDNRIRRYGLLRKTASSLPSFYVLMGGAIGLREDDNYGTRAEARALNVVVSVCHYVGISDPLLCARLYLYRQACRIF